MSIAACDAEEHDTELGKDVGHAVVLLHLLGFDTSQMVSCCASCKLLLHRPPNRMQCRHLPRRLLLNLHSTTTLMSFSTKHTSAQSTPNLFLERRGAHWHSVPGATSSSWSCLLPLKQTIWHHFLLWRNCLSPR